MEQDKEGEERDLSLTESDYVLIRMVVGLFLENPHFIILCGICQIDICGAII